MPAGFVGGKLQQRFATMALIVAAIAVGLFLAAGMQSTAFGGSSASGESNSGDVVVADGSYEW
ncbi:hypothetical protein [Catenuloplanes japonicus]|uniref:hypothetical protein n=1 Tax=Catenuloplanes japonicus TaxID=33876 RepID=UPI0012FAF85D|nr:hypothetical protein [Catenuloplanes japonicus]